MPQSHVCVLWLPEVGMMLSPKKYVPLRTQVLKMNSKSLEVDDAEEHGLWVFSDGAQGQSMGQRLALKMASILPRAGVRACSNEVASCLQARW